MLEAVTNGVTRRGNPDIDTSDILKWGRYRPYLLHAYLLGNVTFFNQLTKWRQTMARRTFTIELKVDFDEGDNRYEPMTKIVGQAAKDLLAVSTLLAANKKPPQVVWFTEDAFFDTTQLGSSDDQGTLERFENEPQPDDEPRTEDEVTAAGNEAG
jgi:hypothetical protein